VRVLDASLRLLHPFTPFVTEELWGHLKRAAQEQSERFAPKGGWEEALILARYPEPAGEEAWEQPKTADFNLVMEVTRAIRNLRAEKKVQPAKRIPALIAAGDRLVVLQSQVKTLAALAMLDPDGLRMVESLTDKPQGQAGLVVTGVEIYLPLAELVDAEAERLRMQKELAEVEGQIERLQKLLGSTFADKAPAAVVAKERQKLATFQDTAEKLKTQIGG
jgi:valyl-tRNA synthetase